MTGKKFFTVFIISTVVFTLLISFFYHRKLQLAEEQLLSRFHKRADGIKKELQEKTACGPEQIERSEKAVRILGNNTFDSNAVVFNIMLISPSNERPYVTLFMEIVDELSMVYQINYSTGDIASENQGNVFLTPSNLPPPGVRYGICTLIIPLKSDSKLSEDATPYAELEGEICYLNLAQGVFDSIVSKEVAFIVLDENERVLDRISMKGFVD